MKTALNRQKVTEMDEKIAAIHQTVKQADELIARIHARHDPSLPWQSRD